LSVPIVGVVSDGQDSIRKAVKKALDGVPHQLCHFHYLREAAQPVYEADRHAKVPLKKKVRGIRPIERKVEGRDDAEAQDIRGYCAAVRSALTDDGRPPLVPSGLKLVDRLAAVAASLDRVAAKRAPEGADAAAGDPGAGPGGDRGLVAGRGDRLRLGAPRGGYPAQQEGAGRLRRAAALPRADRCDRSSPGQLRPPAGGLRALPEGDAELLAGVVPVLSSNGTSLVVNSNEI
jgi:hypothetical protein